jgi:hypothetical protein
MDTQSSRIAAIKAAADQAAVSLTVEEKEASTTDSLMVEAKEATKLNSKKFTSGTCSPRSEEDEAAGSMLMGFLSSLRKGYEDAMKDKDRSEKETKTSEKPSLSGQKRSASEMVQKPKKTKGPAANCVTPAPSATTTERTETSSGTTSYRADSSLEDFMSSSETDKGKDPSSSEDSDKDYSGERGSSEEQGSLEKRASVPPRKRMKGKGTVGEFTKKNIAKHNHRMDAMRSRITMNRPDLGSPRNQRTGRED